MVTMAKPKTGREAAKQHPPAARSRTSTPPSIEPAGVRASLTGRVERWVRQSLDRMSDAEVLKLIEAQSAPETVAEILIATAGTAPSAEGDWADLLLRGAEARREIAELVGGLLSSSQAAAILRISVPGVKQRMERRRVLAVPMSGGQWGFPALQFDAVGHVRPGLPEALQASAHVPAWTLLSILVDDVEDARGGMLLERLDDERVLRDVMNRVTTYGEHVAA
jgi:hypothetical protein